MGINKGLQVKVEKYQFASFGKLADNSVSDFIFPAIENELKGFNEDLQINIRREREEEKKHGFEIAKEVRDLRGIVDQEQSDWEKSVEDEVTRRLALIEKDAYTRGLAEGKVEGNLTAKLQAQKEFNLLLEEYSGLFQNTKEMIDKIYTENKLSSLSMVKNLTKWVLLKEIKDEDYLARLLEKLIYEINTKNNLVLRVNKESFEAMPGIVSKVESKLGQLPNIRVEIELNLNEKGIILESENGIIDGSLEAQFKTIDKIFESIGVVDEPRE